MTHFHSDHTVGYPDLILTPWVLGRRVPLEVYGPSGIKAMTEHLLEAYRVDFATRTNPQTGSGGQVAEGHAVNTHEVRAGVVYKDGNVTVTAFPTKHAMESFASKYHTSTAQLAELATQAKPRLLILYHHAIALRPDVNPGASSSANYSGKYPRAIRVMLSWVMISRSTESLGDGWKTRRLCSTAGRSVTPKYFFYRTRDASQSGRIYQLHHSEQEGG